MTLAFIEELQVDELESFIDDMMFGVSDEWETITETDIDEWSNI